MLGSNVSSQLLLLCFLPFITLKYTSSDFGVWVLFTSVCTFYISISTLRLDAFLVVCDVSDMKLIVKVALLISNVIFIPTLLIYYTLSSNNNLITIALFTINAFISVRNQLYSSYATRFGNFGVISSAKIIQTLAFIVTVLCLTIIDSNNGLNLIFGTVTSSLFVMIFYSVKNYSIGYSFFASFTEINKVYAIGKSFIKFDSPTVILNNISSNMPLWAITMIWGDSAAGVFGLAHRLIGLPVSLISGAVGKVFYRDFNNSTSKVKTYSLYFRILIFTMGLPFIVFYFNSDFLFFLFFNKEWGTSLEFVLILLPWMFLVLTVSPLTYSHLVINTQKNNLQANMILFSVRLILVIYVFNFSAFVNAHWFVNKFVVLGAIYWLFQAGLMYFLIKRFEYENKFKGQ